MSRLDGILIEELVAYGLAVAVGAIPTAGAIAGGGRWGAAATVGAVVVLLGACGIGRAIAAARRGPVPRARATRSRGARGPRTARDPDSAVREPRLTPNARPARWS